MEERKKGTYAFISTETENSTTRKSWTITETGQMPLSTRNEICFGEGKVILPIFKG